MPPTLSTTRFSASHIIAVIFAVKSSAAAREVGSHDVVVAFVRAWATSGLFPVRTLRLWQRLVAERQRALRCDACGGRRSRRSCEHYRPTELQPANEWLMDSLSFRDGVLQRNAVCTCAHTHTISRAAENIYQVNAQTNAHQRTFSRRRWHTLKIRSMLPIFLLRLSPEGRITCTNGAVLLSCSSAYPSHSDPQSRLEARTNFGFGGNIPQRTCNWYPHFSAERSKVKVTRTGLNFESTLILLLLLLVVDMSDAVNTLQQHCHLVNKY